MMALEAAYCKLDAAKADYAKQAKNAKEAKEKEETPAPEAKKKAKEPKDKTNDSASDIIANAAAVDAAKKARDNASKKVKEVKLAVVMAGAKPFELYANLLSDKA